MTTKLWSRIVISYAGMGGVYNIEKHYRYEEGRGVAFLSTMERAMGGFPGFASLSPAVILDCSPGRARKQMSRLSATCVPSLVFGCLWNKLPSVSSVTFRMSFIGHKPTTT